MLFALEDEPARDAPAGEPSCEEACPVADHIEEMFGASALPPEKQLARHLNNHMREALIESGMFELMARLAPDSASALTDEDRAEIQRAGENLKRWSCSVRLDEPDKKMLREAVSRLPRSAWLEQPRTLWRLRKKLKAG